MQLGIHKSRSIAGLRAPPAVDQVQHHYHGRGAFHQVPVQSRQAPVYGAVCRVQLITSSQA